MGTFTGYYIVVDKNGLPLNNVTVELMEITEFTPASPNPQEHIVSTGTTTEAGEVTFGSLDDSKRYFARARAPDARVYVVLPTSTGGSGAPASASFVTLDAEAGLSNETRHRNITGDDLHDPKAHTIASHSDTTATGAELEALTDGSDAGALHIHDARYYTEAETDAAIDADVATHAGVADAHHTKYTDAEAVAAIEAETTLEFDGASAISTASGNLTINAAAALILQSAGVTHITLQNNQVEFSKPPAADTINELTATAGVTIDPSEGAGQGAWIVDNKVYPRKDMTDVYLTVNALGDMYLMGDATDNDYFFFDTSLDKWLIAVANSARFIVNGQDSKIEMNWPLDMNSQNLTEVGTIGCGAITSSAGGTFGSDVLPDTDDTDDLGSTSKRWGNLHLAHEVKLDAAPDADHEVSGITAVFTANENQAIGDICYIDSNGEMHLADADAIATSKVVGMCADATISADASGDYLLLGFARDDTWNWTVGGLIYLSTTGTTGNTMTQTAPSGEDDCIVIVGIATHADRIYFNPLQQAIVEHAA